MAIMAKCGNIGSAILSALPFLFVLFQRNNEVIIPPIPTHDSTIKYTG